MHRTIHRLLCSGLLCATVPAIAQHAQAFVEMKRAFVHDKGERVQVDIALVGSSVATGDSLTHVLPTVEVITMVEQNDSVMDFRKSEVTIPLVDDTQDFIHQEFFLLPPGAYGARVELRNTQGTKDQHTGYHLPLVVADRSAGPSASDIQLLAPNTSGGDALPFLGHYYPEDVNTLYFHAELYGLPERIGKDSLFLLSYQLETFETRVVKGGYRKVVRATATPVVDVDGAFPIGDLPSGNYLLSIEAKDRSGALLVRQEMFLQRNNPILYDPEAAIVYGANFTDAMTNADTLAEFLRSMVPIAEDLERRLIETNSERKDLSDMQRIMFAFWHNRNSADPKGAWDRYHEAVVEVNRMFGCRNLRGYASDQGRVYLKYGAPNTLVDRPNETSVIPYQIWHYYHAGRYRDKRFVFWQPERSTTCWQMLHSDVPGEMKNPRWNQMLHQTDNPMNLYESVSGGANSSESGQRVLDNYYNPR